MLYKLSQYGKELLAHIQLNNLYGYHSVSAQRTDLKLSVILWCRRTTAANRNMETISTFTNATLHPSPYGFKAAHCVIARIGVCSTDANVCYFVFKLETKSVTVLHVHHEKRFYLQSQLLCLGRDSQTSKSTLPCMVKYFFQNFHTKTHSARSTPRLVYITSRCRMHTHLLWHDYIWNAITKTSFIKWITWRKSSTIIFRPYIHTNDTVLIEPYHLFACKCKTAIGSSTPDCGFTERNIYVCIDRYHYTTIHFLASFPSPYHCCHRHQPYM